MKHIFIITPLAVFLLLTSCKKDWTCTCKDEKGFEVDYEVNNMKKSGAKKACNEYEYSDGDDCELK